MRVIKISLILLLLSSLNASATIFSFTETCSDANPLGCTHDLDFQGIDSTSPTGTPLSQILTEQIQSITIELLTFDAKLTSINGTSFSSAAAVGSYTITDPSFLGLVPQAWSISIDQTSYDSFKSAQEILRATSFPWEWKATITTATTVPEPYTLGLMGLGLLALVRFKRKA